MRDFLLRTTQFVVTAFAGYGLILGLGLVSPFWEGQFIVRTNDSSGLNRKIPDWNARVAAGATNDFLFLGSSTCELGVDPAALEAYGLEGFNLCSSGQQLVVSEHLLGPLLATGHPRAVVLDVYLVNWKGDWPLPVLSPRDWIVNGGLGTSTLQDALLPITVSTADPYTALLAAYFQIRPHFVPIGSRARPDDRGTYVARGYYKHINTPLKAMPPPPDCEGATDFLVDAVRRIGEVCTESGIDLILLHPPVLGCDATSLPSELAHLPVIDGNMWPGKADYTNFYDDHHLVHAGAMSYSAWLAEQLAKRTP